ncbi:hypothetical protein GOODEAATRI_015103, partial [Goodea atripinnis]
ANTWKADIALQQLLLYRVWLERFPLKLPHEKLLFRIRSCSAKRFSVMCLLPLGFTEARAVFLVGQNYVTQDHSSLFRALAFFEEDLERRCKMHKRRVDMLEPICNGTNLVTHSLIFCSAFEEFGLYIDVPLVYFSVDLNSRYYLLIRRQLMFELAETYNEMMDLKLTLANRQADNHSLDSHTIKKFNHLCSASAKYFQMFLDSLCSPEGKQPEHLEEEVLRPALVARFRVARLHSKLISSSPPVQLENLNRALENYKYVVQYCEAHPEAAAAVETELELSTEMVGLLPLKINRLKSRMAANN